MNSATSDAILARMMALHPKIIDLGLERVQDLLHRLDHPERRLPPVVHVAGTNGKGSTIAFLRAMLEAEGRSVQCYTSPHLVRFHERIRINGKLISEDTLVSLLERCEAANDRRNITYFEITTIAAFLAFAESPSDILLLETGLGGRLDATNVVTAPALCVITPISLDHTQFLGETLPEIAGEKAGILKSGSPAVVGRQEEEALSVIEARARAIDAPLLRLGKEWHYEARADQLYFEDLDGSIVLPKPGLPGAHQWENAALAVAAARQLGELSPGTKAIAEGFAKVEWPARLQQLTSGPLIDAIAGANNEDWELWLDGGHNEAAGQRLAESLGAWGEKPVHLVYGMMNTKAAVRYLEPLAKKARSLRAITIPGEPNALSAEEAATAARRAGFSARAFPDAATACRTILREEEPGPILICGSLYLAGSVLKDHA